MDRLGEMEHYQIASMISDIQAKYRSLMERLDGQGDAAFFSDLLSKKSKFIEKMLLQSNNYTLAQLSYALEILFQIDAKAKRSDVCGAEQLFMLISILNSRRKRPG